MENEDQSMADLLGSNLPDAIQNLQNLLGKLQSISAEDADSRKKQLHSFVSTAKPTVKALLEVSGLASPGSEATKPSKQNCGLLNEKGKKAYKGRHYTRSASYQSVLQPVEEKPDKHRRRGHISVPQELLMSSINHREEIKHELGMNQYGSSPLLLGDSMEPNGSISEVEDKPWGTIKQWGKYIPAEESPATDIRQCQIQLQLKKATLEEQIMQLEKTTMAGKDREKEALREELDICMHELGSLLSQYEDVRSKLAKKEKECYKLHCDIGQASSNITEDMDEREVFEFELWNVKTALKWCDTILDSKTMQKYALKNIVKLAEGVKGL